MITRDEAVEVLYELINSGILSETIEENLRDIASCITAEKELQIHAWGMNSAEFAMLYTGHRSDLPDFDEFMAKCDKIVEKHKFTEGSEK